VKIEYHDELVSPYQTTADRIIVRKTETKPQKIYRRYSLGALQNWVEVTPQKTTIEFNEYAAIDLVAQYNTSKI